MLSGTPGTYCTLWQAGVEAGLHLYEGRVHAGYLILLTAPESAEHFAELNRFVLKHLSAPLPAESAFSADQNEVGIPESVIGYVDEDGKIVEHRDSIQDVPGETGNGNTIY